MCELASVSVTVSLLIQTTHAVFKMDIIGSAWAQIDQLKITEEVTADSGFHFPGLVDVHASATQ